MLENYGDEVSFNYGCLPNINDIDIENGIIISKPVSYVVGVTPLFDYITAVVYTELIYSDGEFSVSRAWIEGATEDLSVITDIDDWEKLGLWDWDGRNDYIRAFLTKDIEALERMAGVQQGDSTYIKRLNSARNIL